MAKGFFGSLKGIDAFGKARRKEIPRFLVEANRPSDRLRTMSRSRQKRERYVRSDLLSFVVSHPCPVTLLSAAIILAFTMIEFIDYRTVYTDTSVLVDKSRGQRLTVNMNVTFPRVPCYRA